MFNLLVLQAAHGDCLILEFGPPDAPRHVLVDGGPAGTYKHHLRPWLEKIGATGRRLELAILSHVDNDHVVGLLDLFGELRRQRAKGERELVEVAGLWHNSFEQSVGEPGFEAKLRAALPARAAEAAPASGVAMALRSIAEGHELAEDAKVLGIPSNVEFPEGQIIVEQARPLELDNVTLRIVGPSRRNFDELREKWLEWLEKQRQRVSRGEPLLAAEVDRSVPNLSSICLLVEAEGASLLLTGDARSDHVLDGLSQAGALGSDGKLHVSILKMPHHGSIRNVTPEFLRAVTADRYVISANGRHGNPDVPCLTGIVEAARDAGREIEIWLTNETPSTQLLVQSHPPERFGYRLCFLPPDESVLTLVLGDDSESR